MTTKTQKVKASYTRLCNLEQRLERVKRALKYNTGTATYEIYGVLMSAHRLLDEACGQLGLMPGDIKTALVSGEPHEGRQIREVASVYNVPVEDAASAVGRVVDVIVEAVDKLAEKSEALIGELKAKVPSKRRHAAKVS